MYGSRSYCPLPFFINDTNDDYKSASCSKGQNRHWSAKRYTSLSEQLVAQSLSVLNSRDVVGVANQRESAALVEAGTAAGLHLV